MDIDNNQTETTDQDSTLLYNKKQLLNKISSKLNDNVDSIQNYDPENKYVDNPQLIAFCNDHNHVIFFTKFYFYKK